MDIIRLPEHPLFAHASRWVGEGTYLDEDGNILPMTGVRTVRRDWRIAYEDGDSSDPLWRVEQDLRLLMVQGEHPVFASTFAIEPPETGFEAYWTWDSLALGAFAGRFFAVGDSVMNQAFSQDGQFVLSECWILAEDDDIYLSRSVLTRQGSTIGSWSMTWESREMERWHPSRPNATIG